jgi:hypothetical protein
MAPFCLKGLIDTIINIRLTGGSKGIDGFPGGHPNFNNGHLGLMENIVGRVLSINMHPKSFRPKEIKDQALKNVKQLSNVREATNVVTLNIKMVFFSFNNKFT